MEAPPTLRSGSANAQGWRDEKSAAQGATLDAPPTTFNILIPEKLGEPGLEVLREQANVDVALDLSHDELLAKVPLCDALIVRSATKVGRDVFEAAKGRLKVSRRGGPRVSPPGSSPAPGRRLERRPPAPRRQAGRPNGVDLRPLRIHRLTPRRRRR